MVLNLEDAEGTIARLCACAQVQRIGEGELVKRAFVLQIPSELEV